MSSAERSLSSSPAGRAAAEWVLRHDRGLAAGEQDEFSQWLAADPAHRAAWAEHRWGWDELDRLAGLQTSVRAVPDPDLLKPGKARRLIPALPPSLPLLLSLSFAAAATLAFAAFFWSRPAAPFPPATVAAVAPATPLALIERRELPEGSVIELNRGAIVEARFSPGERRVKLLRGEAHFNVAPDATRPFVVDAGGVAVRAVGTAFNVRLDSAAVEILVTEGQVAVGADKGGQRPEAGHRLTDEGRPTTKTVPPAAAVQSPPAIFSHQSSGIRHPASGVVVSAGERTVVSFAPAAPPPQVQPVTPAEVEARLAWQPRLLDFTNAPLPEILAEFNRRNPVRLGLGDPELAALRLSATFRSDNVEGFVRLMISDFGMRAVRRAEGEIVLVSAP